MIVQATVTIPPQYITTAITMRRRSGRPAPETVSEPRRKLDFEVVTCVADRLPVESGAGMDGEEKVILVMMMFTGDLVLRVACRVP